jgi:hypothetical protein
VALDQVRKHHGCRAIAALERIDPPPCTGDWRAPPALSPGFRARTGLDFI